MEVPEESQLGVTMTTDDPNIDNLDKAEGIDGEKITETFGMGLLK